MNKLLLIPAAALLLAACAGTDEPATTTPAAAETGPGAAAQKVVAEQAGVAPGDVSIESVTAVEFPNSGLGCPQPDMAYLAVITPGHTVIATVGDTEYDVRVAGEQALICVPAPPPASQR